MRKKLFTAAFVSLLAVASFGAPARADDRLFVSGPGGGFGAGYTVPVIVILEGDTVTYRNIDVASHDVRSVVKGPDRPWCKQFPFNFPNGTCPLFSSRLIGLSGTSPVYGIEDASVPPGETVATFSFYCTLHNWMTGTLVVVGGP